MLGRIQFKNRDCFAHCLVCVKQLVPDGIQLFPNRITEEWPVTVLEMVTALLEGILAFAD